MAKVTYRGVSYDTNDKKSCQKEATVLTYRGIKHTESKTVLVLTHNVHPDTFRTQVSQGTVRSSSFDEDAND